MSLTPPASLFAAPLWASAFRPFFVLGLLYGIGALSAALIAGDINSHGHALRHGHEMIFGFTGAIVAGVVLTALPSWAGTPEIRHGRLAFLVALWLAGRLVMLARLGGPVALLLDCALFPAMAAMLAPQLARVANKWYLLALPGLLLLAGANALFHLAADAAAAGAALKLAVYVLMGLYVLKSGVFIPVFTSNVLLAQGRAAVARHAGLEAAALLAIAALASADLTGAPGPWVAALALLAGAINAARLGRWRGWRVLSEPIVFNMQLGIAWLTLALFLRAAALLAPALPAGAWLHAFTVGGLGHCMIALMTRVVLKHTGRPLLLAPAIRLAYALMFAAAVTRLLWAVAPDVRALLSVSTLLWIAAFAIYLWLYGAMMCKPSLPQEPRPARA